MTFLLRSFRGGTVSYPGERSRGLPCSRAVFLNVIVQLTSSPAKTTGEVKETETRMLEGAGWGRDIMWVAVSGRDYVGRCNGWSRQNEGIGLSV